VRRACSHAGRRLAKNVDIAKAGIFPRRTVGIGFQMAIPIGFEA